MSAAIAYPELTTSKLSVSEVPTGSGGTFEVLDPLPEVTPDLAGASCSNNTVVHEWVPSAEAALVPTELTAICRSCPVRAACLAWAIAHQPVGYWAATTSSDRRVLLREDTTSVARADEIQDEIFDEVYPSPIHSGPGCRHWYREGCRCMECRTDRATYRQVLRSTTAKVPRCTTPGCPKEHR